MVFNMYLWDYPPEHLTRSTAKRQGWLWRRAHPRPLGSCRSAFRTAYMELSSTCSVLGGKTILCDQGKGYLAPSQQSYSPRLRAKPSTHCQPHPIPPFLSFSPVQVDFFVCIFGLYLKSSLDQVKQKLLDGQTSKPLTEVIRRRKPLGNTTGKVRRGAPHSRVWMKLLPAESPKFQRTSPKPSFLKV